MQRFLSLLLALLLVAQPLLPSLAFAKEQEARVTANSLNVRSGPGTDNPAVESVKKGELVTIVSTEGDWSQIRLEDGTLGWVATKYLEATGKSVEAPGKEEKKSTPPEPKPLPPPKQPKQPKSSGGGGGGFGSVVKWSCLVGAAATGALAFSEHSKGNDSYDSYKEFVEQGNTAAADSAFADADDHDSKAQTFAIVGGSLFALFLLQQFVLGGHDDHASKDDGKATLPLAWDARRHQLRASLVLARF